MGIIYLNNAATSHPKPEKVSEATLNALQSIPPAELRSNLSDNGTDLLHRARCTISDFFNLGDQCSLIFTSGGTESLNLIIRGTIQENDHVITTAAEHNAVLRPLNWLKAKKGIEITTLPVSEFGWVDPQSLKDAIRPETKAFIIGHVSNVTGTIQDLFSISLICQENGILLLIDGCQGSGNVNVNFREFGCAAYVFTGHKGLMGPPGTGGIIIKNSLINDTSPLHFGGVGYAAEKPLFVDDFPAKFEVGTQNYPGFAGLEAGIEWLQETDTNDSKVPEMGTELAEAISELPGLRVIKGNSKAWFPGIVSFTIQGLDSQEIAGFLSEEHGIICRSGYCCAPLIHKYIGSQDSGVVRLSPGRFNTRDDINLAIEAIRGVCKLAV
ncbi:MAG: aminotransferase class V-fold PLP-dependent enzyme [bacterium]|nr:aminotransferase class V-fold PLP-dependent enzyme [bacterium]